MLDALHYKQYDNKLEYYGYLNVISQVSKQNQNIDTVYMINVSVIK